jgi:hypothetical protein
MTIEGGYLILNHTESLVERIRCPTLSHNPHADVSSFSASFHQRNHSISSLRLPLTCKRVVLLQVVTVVHDCNFSTWPCLNHWVPGHSGNEVSAET